MTPRLAPVALALLTLAGCAEMETRTAMTGPGAATLRIAGDGVRVNGAPAAAGQAIVSGDRVATGPGGSALITFADGTSVQLDENSDDVRFTWEGDRLRLAFDDTAAKVEKGGSTGFIEVVGKMASFFSWSEFVVEETFPRQFRVDLFEGGAKINRPPGDVEIGGGDFFLLGESGPPQTGVLTEERIRMDCERFERWNFDNDPDCGRIVRPIDEAGLGPWYAGPGLAGLLIGAAIVGVSGGGSTTSTTDTLADH